MSKKQIAFTLIELLVVIAIIGILSGLIIVGMSGMTQKATIAKSQVFSNSLRNSLLMSIVGEWKLDEVNGTAANDTWTRANNGTLYNFTDTVTPGYGDSSSNADGWMSSSNCISGTCLKFDGVDDYITRSNIPLSDLNEITLEAWVKPSILTVTQTIICENGPFIFNLVNNKFSSDNMIYAGGVWTAISGIKTLTVNTWIHLAMTYGSGYIKTYINGEFDNSVAKTGSLGGAGRFVIGGNSTGSALPNSQFFSGLVDEVRLYNAAMSTSQIQEQYYAGLNKLLSNGGISLSEYRENVLNLQKHSASK